ncbi:MAG: hypothetical protein GXY32_01545 [Ruminococcaceae bacterium]|nr:hypothetical protein [Oscillospiraceae bacterium]
MGHQTLVKPRMPAGAKCVLALHLFFGAILVVLLIIGSGQIHNETFKAEAIAYYPDYFHSVLVSMMICFLLTVAYWGATILWIIPLLCRASVSTSVHAVLVGIECILPVFYLYTGVKNITKGQPTLSNVFTNLAFALLLTLFVAGIVYMLRSKKLRAYLTR